MRTWLTTIGTSPFAVINTVWASARFKNYVPERVHLIYNDITERYLGEVKDWIGRICMAYGVNDVTFVEHRVEEVEFSELKGVLFEIVEEEKREGNTVAIDITPGRKFMSALAMYCGFAHGNNGYADHIFYLHLKDTAYLNHPFGLIPFTAQKLHDLKEEITE